MLDDASGNPPGTDPGTRGHGTWVEDPFAVVIDFPSDDGSDGDGDDRGLINAGLESNDDPDSTGNDRFSVDFGNIFDDGLDDKLADGNDGERELSFGASSEEYGELDVDLSPWAPLLGMLDSTEPEASANDRPFTPSEGVKEAHALELRAESMLQYCERGAERTGKLDRTEVGVSDDNRDIVAGRDHVEIDGMLEEHTGHGLVYVADDVEMNVAGPLRVHAHLEDNIIMAGVMTDEWKGGTFITAAMSDDMAAGLGLRCTAPLDVWVHGLVGMEERPGTCAADGILHEIAGTLYEREYGPSAHVALVARHSGTVVTTMKTGFRPLMKTAIGVRNLIPGGGGGGGGASASPPAAPPAPGGGGEAAGAGVGAGAVTLTAVEGGGALGRGVAGSGDTEEIISVARTAESASQTTEIENLQHPASTADNVDNLARVEVDGTGYQQVAEIYEQPVPASAMSEPDGGGSVHSRLDTVDGSQTGEGALVEPHRLEGNPELNAWVDGGSDGDDVVQHAVVGGEHRVDLDISDPGGASASATDAQTPLPSRRPPEDSTPTSNPELPDSVFATPRPAALDLTEPGTEGFDFGKTYDALRNRQQHYRDFTNWRGNLALEEAIGAIDKRATELFKGLGGSADDLPVDSSVRTMAIRNELDNMAAQAEAAGDADRLADIHRAIDEFDALVYDTATTMAARADEFSGAAIGSQRVPIDPYTNTEKLRGWLQEQMLKAQSKYAEAAKIANSDAAARAQQLATLEEQFYYQMIMSLDRGVSPLYVSNDLILLFRADVDAYYKTFADEVADLAKEGWDLVPPRPMKEDELDLLLDLQGLLVTTLRDPEYIRSVEEMAAGTFTQPVRIGIEAGLDVLEPDSLRLATDGEAPPSLPAPSHSYTTGDLDAARNRYFSRSALEASAETLERRVLDFSEQDAVGPSRSSSSGLGSEGSGIPGVSSGNHRAPPDNARAPVIDEQSAMWIVEPSAGPDASPTTSDSASPLAHGDGTSSQVSPVSWDSGLRESDDSEVGAATGGAHDAETSDLFKAPSEPNDENADEAQHAAAASDGSSGSPAAGSDATGGTDPNPTGTVSEPTDSITTTSGMGTGTEPGSSGTSPGTPDPVSTGTHAFEAPAPYLGFDPDGDVSAAPDWARDDFEVERALNVGRLPPEFDASGLGDQWTRSVTDS